LCRVSAEYKGYYGLFPPQGGEVLGIIRKRMLMQGGRMALPVVGDWVLAEERPGEERLRIARVLDRKGLIIRREAGRSGRQQPFAANVDVALIVAGLDQEPNMARLERFCAIAQRGGAEPWVLLNKQDICQQTKQILEMTQQALPGVRVLALSAETGQGMESLETLLKNHKTLVLLGPSGVGKSSIVNHLLGCFTQDTTDVREGDGKGRHTTTFRRMMALPGGAWLIDSPGVRELGVVDEEGLDDTFDDVLAFATGCRFRDCDHHEEPGCAVRLASEDGRLDAMRYASYQKLATEARQHQARVQQGVWDYKKKVLKVQSKALKQQTQLHRPHNP
jgi:ribosome biogenesis GTPase